MNTIWQEELFEDHKTGKYLRYLSHTAAGEGRNPLLLQIHGAGSRGESLDTFAHVGPVGELDHGRAIAAHIVAPQCHVELAIPAGKDTLLTNTKGQPAGCPFTLLILLFCGIHCTLWPVRRSYPSALPIASL